MAVNTDFIRSLPRHEKEAPRRWPVRFDPVLLVLILTTIAFGLVVLLSASGKNWDAVLGQLSRVGLGCIAMLVVAQLPPDFFRQVAVWAYIGVVILLVVVLMFEPIKGSRRWIRIPGVFSFQPSEMAKLAVPMMVAAFLCQRPLPPRLVDVLLALAILAVPTVLIVIEPDLGTGVLIAAAGFGVLLFAGIYWRWVFLAGGAVIAGLPLLWLVMKEYQRNRVLTLIDPERDPLGTGWNTIQAMTAIGSGGVFGKGLFKGTQSHLDFLPEGRTDFIVAVLAEEFGLVGVLVLLLLYIAIIGRGMLIVSRTRDPFARILGGSLILTFFVYAFVNMAMVSGIAPVVGVPLPLVSYGGTAMITLLTGFGILMSIHSHQVHARH
jgi:rod shape determining protein RodA